MRWRKRESTGRMGRRTRVVTLLAAAVLGVGATGLGVDPEVWSAEETQGEGVWATTAPLSVPLYDHSTTLLADGDVLVAAGRKVLPGQPTELSASAERYDPVEEAWQPAASLEDARWRHTATLMRDGRLLVAGGFGGSLRTTNAQPVLDTAEIYDPATDTRTRTAPMNVRRALHAAILLPDGKVLVAGGRTCDRPPPAACDFTFRTPTTEVCDPVAKTWALGTRMLFERHTTAAALLPDGTVLVPAGFGNEGANRTGDVHDPSSPVPILGGVLNTARARQGAMALPDGRVLVAAGFQGANTAETFDPGSRLWTATGNLALPTRFNFNYAVLPNGKALVAGGATFPPAGRTRTAELYDPRSGLWGPASDMNDEHGSSSSLANSSEAVVLSSNPFTFEAHPGACGANCGKVLVAGNSPTGSVELYTPTCPTTPPPPRPQRLACVGDGRPGRANPGGPPGRPTDPGRPDEP